MKMHYKSLFSLFLSIIVLIAFFIPIEVAAVSSTSYNNTAANTEDMNLVFENWGIFDPEAKTLSGIYENTSIQEYIRLLKATSSTGNVVVLKNGVEQSFGCLEQGMIVRCYVNEVDFCDYTIVEVLSLSQAPEASNRSTSETNSVNSYGFVLPLDQMDVTSNITSPYGYRYHPLSGDYKLHAGIDIAWSEIYGTPVKAVRSGTVTVSWDEDGYGNYVMIDHGTVNGERIQTLYAHMSQVAVTTGQTVNQGDIIGYVGSTGGSTGPHLHFEVRIGTGTFFNCSPVDPIPYLTDAEPSVTPNDGKPIGNYDGASGGIGRVRVYGWAFDYDDPSASLRIHVYVGGPAGSTNAIGYDVGVTTILRNDVNRIYDITGNHGFDFTISTTKRGSQEVYVYAINVGEGSSKLLGSKTVDIPTGKPIGSYDGAVGGVSTVRVYGWAFDYDDPSASLRIHVYVGGPAGSTNAIGYDVGVTTILRNDVNNTYGISGRHGFDYTVSTTKQGEQDVYVYAINVGEGGHKLLGTKTVTIS